jgi:RluA family pseudouridine synthase
VAKPNSIELPDCEPIPILYEDRSVLAVDKPRGWMLLPVSWQNTGFNLQAALNSSIAARDFWARSRGIKFLRYIHRLDGDTSGILLFAKSQGAVETYSNLFEGRRMEKTYLAIVAGEPKQTEWICQLKLAPDPRQIGRMKVDSREGKEAETHFRLLQKHDQFALLEAKPVTGRTHQIRVHLAEANLPIAGDELYGNALAARKPQGNLMKPSASSPRPSPSLVAGERERLANKDRMRGNRRSKVESSVPLGLRAVRLAYADPFTRRSVDIQAPTEKFLQEFGFDLPQR